MECVRSSPLKSSSQTATLLTFSNQRDCPDSRVHRRLPDSNCAAPSVKTHKGRPSPMRSAAPLCRANSMADRVRKPPEPVYEAPKTKTNNDHGGEGLRVSRSLAPFSRSRILFGTRKRRRRKSRLIQLYQL